MTTTQTPPSSIYKAGRSLGRKPTRPMNAALIVAAAVLAAGFGIGFGVGSATSSDSTLYPQTGTVIAVNPPVPGDNMTSEGALKEANGSVIPVAFFASGVLLHSGEHVSYVQVPIAGGGTATLITAPANPSFTEGG